MQGQFKHKLHFFRIPGVFQEQGHFQGLFKVCANPAIYLKLVPTCFKFHLVHVFDFYLIDSLSESKVTFPVHLWLSIS